MLKYLMLSFIVLFVNVGFAQKKTEYQKLNLHVGVGQRIEYFNWSIAGNIEGVKPNILSELIWSDLKSTSFELKSDYHIYKRLHVSADFSKSLIYAGRVTDMDYQEDNRRNNTFAATLNSNNGNVIRFNVKLGYELQKERMINLTAYLGYAVNKQLLYLSDDHDASQSERLRSSYSPLWQGVSFTLKAQTTITKKLSITSISSFSRFDYQAVADWNLITEYNHPISFSHIAHGYSYESVMAFNLLLARKLSLSFSFEGFYMKTNKGTDRLYLATGEQAITQFNGAKNKGLIASTGLNFFW